MSTPYDLGGQKIHILVSGTVIADRCPQAVTATQGRVGDHCQALFLKLQHDFRVEAFQRNLIQATWIIAEASAPSL